MCMVVLFTTHKYRITDMPLGIKNNIIEWWQLNPELTFIYFDDHQMIEWLTTHLTKKEQYYFNQINTGAGRADFFRIYYIYYQGGIWVDCDLPAFHIHSKFRIVDALHKIESIVIRNRKCNNPRYTLLAGNSHALLFQKLIAQIVQNIQNELELPMNKNTLDITGPFVLHHLLCDTLHLYSIDRLQINKIYCLKRNSTPFLLYLDDIVPERSTYEEENTCNGYRQMLHSLFITHHSSLPPLKKNINHKIYMGKKSKKPKQKYPFVSICTPTYNRRPFILSMFECFKHQTYPKERMEWIIIDDGTDKIKDLIESSGIDQIKYIALDKKMTLGKKRNMLHDQSKGDIIVYMDDDDYYPPTRVSHAVETLKKSPSALIAGSSKLYIYFKHVKEMYLFGPYGPQHATAGTFAFKRQLLKKTKYNEAASLAEEKEFLKNYTIPMVQLDPMQVILVFSHSHNTFDKKELLIQPNSPFRHKSECTVDDFIKEPHLKQFYLVDIEDKLKEYAPGKPSMKPDVIKQTKELRETREHQSRKQENKPTGIKVKTNEQGMKELMTMEVMNILEKQQKEIQRLNAIIQSLKTKTL